MGGVLSARLGSIGRLLFPYFLFDGLLELVEDVGLLELRGHTLI